MPGMSHNASPVDGINAARRGRMAHAGRQRRYRSRMNKVMHQGSATSAPYDSLAPESRMACTHRGASPAVKAQGLYCHFCQRLCAPFVRQDFLHSPGPRLIPLHGGWPLPDR